MITVLSSLKEVLTCCAPPFKMEKTLDEIKTLLEELNTLKITYEPKELKLQKEYKKQQLEKAYLLAYDLFTPVHKTPSRLLALYVGEILFHYGKLCYDENFSVSKEIQLIALNMLLYGLKIQNFCFSFKGYTILEDFNLQAMTKYPSNFQEMEDSLLNIDISTYFEKLLSYPLPQEHLTEKAYLLAKILRQLGHCYQNIDRYKKINFSNDHRFTNLYYFSEKILKHFTSDERYQNELAELYYNAFPFLHLRAHPTDFLGACNEYERALKLNSSLEMQARVANMRYIFLTHAKEHAQAKKELKKAMHIRTIIPKNKQIGLLLANLYKNYSYYLIHLPTPKYAKAKIYLQKALDCVNIF